MRASFIRKLLIWCGVAIVVPIALFLCREPLMGAVGSYLTAEDELTTCQVAFVLGGNSSDRGRKAVELYRNGMTDSVVCLGENVPGLYKAVGIELTESQLTQQVVQQGGVPAAVLPRGTSTREELLAIVEYCSEHQIQKAIVVSDKFHLRRIRWTIDNLLFDHDVELLLCGASSSSYSEAGWWEFEGGLIMVNNEYLKLAYYWYKYR